MRVRDWFIRAHLALYGAAHRAELERLEREDLSDDPEYQAFARELESSWPPPVPEFEPRRTAVFTFLEQRSRMHWYNLWSYRRKIRTDALWLLEHGYTCFVVNYGSRYGLLALEELHRLREAGVEFRLICGKVLGQRWRLSTKREGWHELCMVCACDHNFGMRLLPEYQELVYHRVSAFSGERHFLLSREWIPQWLLENWERTG